MESFSASVLDVSQRIGATHAANFLSAAARPSGVLPAMPAARASAPGRAS